MMTKTKTGIARVILATGILLLSGAASWAAPKQKGEHPAAEKDAPVAPAKVTPAPAQPAPGPGKGPSVTARKGRGSF